MSHYKPYPAYRDSGVEWIGDVPEHWEVKRLKHTITSCKNGVWGDDPVGNLDEDIPCVRVADFDRSQLKVILNDPTMRKVTKSERQGRILKYGDLLLEKSGGGEKQPVGCVVQYEGDQPAVCSNFIARMEVTSQYSASFLKNVHHAIYSVRVTTNSINQTSGIQNLDQERYFNERAAFPSLSVQQEVVSSVDRETKRIDSLISKKTRFIELLKEKRQALITHAVTKGLDPNVTMRDSGDDWIKEIPVTWKSMKFGRIARVTEGLVDPRDEPYRSMVLIAPNHIESGTGRLIQLETAAEQNAESGKYQCRAGNVVYSKIRPALAKVVIAPGDGLCSADMYPLDCTELVEPEWLFYLMLSTSFTAWAILESDRVAMPKINRESLFELGVHVPPRDEQRRVVAFISASVLKSDALLSKTQHSIDLLKERRSAFITAAVTGQIDLREAV